MSMSGPPTFFPPIPINEPGSGPQGVTLEAGVPVFVQSNAAPALSTARGVPLTGSIPTEFSPPVVFDQEDGIAGDPSDDTVFEPGIPEIVPENPIPVLSTGKGDPANFPTVYSPPVNFQQEN
jgi:hypothetical protein